MYIRKVEVRNIRSITAFTFHLTGKLPGWHVLIGDNGSGKSSIVRSIALALIGPIDAQALRLPLINWIQQGCDSGEITLQIERDQARDSYSGQRRPLTKPFAAGVKIFKDTTAGFEIGKIESSIKKTATDPFKYVWSGKSGWFGTSFGPFRRFTGGDKEWSKVYYSNPRAAAHLSVFGEDVALTESLEWLSLMQFQTFESNSIAANILSSLTKFINDGGLLPHGAKLTGVSSNGVTFKDANGFDIDVNQLSDGFRSLLSLIFELIRQLVKTYGETEVFSRINNGEMFIDVPGVVLIDEVDAHLHPTWQTRIGNWFTKYFPNIQFIVTTHSPLVCRASENGSVWRLRQPGSDLASGEVVGKERDRLIFGNILDAYGTEIFGNNVAISENANNKLNRLAELNLKSMMGTATELDEKELHDLKTIMPTGDAR